MTRDDIIRTMREVIGAQPGQEPLMVLNFEQAERFAALVAAPLIEQIERTEKMLDDQYKMGMEAEREACAQEIESWGPQRYVDDLVAAIRARGQLPAHQAFEHGTRIVMEGKL